MCLGMCVCGGCLSYRRASVVLVYPPVLQVLISDFPLYTLFSGYLPRPFQTAEIAFHGICPCAKTPRSPLLIIVRLVFSSTSWQNRHGKYFPRLESVPQMALHQIHEILTGDIYIPANSAAPPTAPRIAAVGKAANAPPPVMPAAVIVVVGMIPDVNGASCTAVAPEKAGVWVVADGFGVASAIMGLRTLRRGQRRCSF